MGEVRAKKALGQHFLVDLNIARKICDSLSGGSAAGGPCTVLEVGCGMGVLTQFLLRRSDIVTWGAEIDPESVAYLHAHYPEFAPRLVAGDFLGMNLRERFPEGLKIIGNFPYNISSQIFFKVLENRDLVPECVGMIQKEVAVRLAEPPGSKEYGILSVLLQAWYDIEYLFTVNETVFNPPPKVKSAVIRLRRNATERLGCDETLFVKVVKASFGQRRKMIRNSLKSVFGDFGGAEHPFFTRRAEQLGVALYANMEDLLPLADFLTVHLPKTDETIGMFGPEQYAAMKDGVILVNVARGGIVDEAALAAALDAGRLAGAGLDVFTHEPLEAGNPLLSVREPDRLLLSPHNAWSPVEAIEILVECIARNIRDFYTPQNQ